MGHPLFSILLCHGHVCPVSQKDSDWLPEDFSRRKHALQGCLAYIKLARILVGVLVLAFVGLLKDPEFAHSASID